MTVKIFLIVLSGFLVLKNFPFQDSSGKSYKPHRATTLVYPPFRHAPVHKAGKLHLMAFMALIGRLDIVPDEPSAITGVRLEATDDPENPSDDDDLTVYAVNSGQNNIIYNSSMQTLDVYEGKTRIQKLSRPKGIAASAKGDVWITDTGNHRVVRLFNPGTSLTYVGYFGKKGKKPGEFDEPNGIALDANSHIYIADTGNDRIQIFDREGKFISFFGNPTDSASSFYSPTALAIADAGFGESAFQENFVVIIDLNGTRLRKFSPDGRFLSGIYSEEYGYPRVHLTSVALDYYHNIWVTDLLNHCIHKFDRNLNYITSFGRVGMEDYEFFEPRAIFIGKKFGQVFILDKFSGQYYHIGTDILNMDIRADSTHVYFRFLLTETSRLSVRIENDKNESVAWLVVHEVQSLGWKELKWNRQFSPRPLLSGFLRPGMLFHATDSLNSPSDSLSTPRKGLFRLVIEARTTYRYSRYFTKTTEVEFAI